MIVVEQNPVGGAIQILILPGPQRPQENRQATPAEEK